jgi:phage FluMu protein Com
MSLICVHCNKIIVQSQNPNHLAGCGDCKLTPEEIKRVEESSLAFRRTSYEHQQSRTEHSFLPG